MGKRTVLQAEGLLHQSRNMTIQLLTSTGSKKHSQALISFPSNRTCKRQPLVLNQHLYSEDPKSTAQMAVKQVYICRNSFLHKKSQRVFYKLCIKQTFQLLPYCSSNPTRCHARYPSPSQFSLLFKGRQGLSPTQSLWRAPRARENTLHPSAVTNLDIWKEAVMPVFFLAQEIPSAAVKFTRAPSW